MMAVMPVDRKLVALRFGRSARDYEGAAVVQKEMAAELADLLIGKCGRSFGAVFEAGCGTGLLTRLLLEKMEMRSLEVNDLQGSFKKYMDALFTSAAGVMTAFRQGDVERMVLPLSRYDLLAANAVFQWLDDLPGFIRRSAAALKKGGVMAFSSFGPENLAEIRELTGFGLAYPALGDIIAAAGAGYEVVHASEKVLTLSFDSSQSVLRHLKATGVNSLAPSAGAWTVKGLRKFAAGYSRFVDKTGNCPLTYHPLYMILRKKF